MLPQLLFVHEKNIKMFSFSSFFFKTLHLAQRGQATMKTTIISVCILLLLNNVVCCYENHRDHKSLYRIGEVEKWRTRCCALQKVLEKHIIFEKVSWAIVKRYTWMFGLIQKTWIKEDVLQAIWFVIIGLCCSMTP